MEATPVFAIARASSRYHSCLTSRALGGLADKARNDASVDAGVNV